MDSLWIISEFAEQQCANHELTKSTIASLLPPPATGRSIHCISTDSFKTFRVLVRDNRIESVKLQKRSSPLPLPDKKVPSASQHCKSRMLERGISKSDVKEALSTPRLSGGKHKGSKCTVVVGTSRKKHVILTAYTENKT